MNVNFLFSLHFIIKNTKVPNRKIGRFCKTPNVDTIAWKARESLETVISPAAIRNLNTFPSLVKSKVLLPAMMSTNGQSKRARNFHFLRRL